MDFHVRRHILAERITLTMKPMKIQFKQNAVMHKAQVGLKRRPMGVGPNCLSPLGRVRAAASRNSCMKLKLL